MPDVIIIAWVIFGIWSFAYVARWIIEKKPVDNRTPGESFRDKLKNCDAILGQLVSEMDKCIDLKQGMDCGQLTDDKLRINGARSVISKIIQAADMYVLEEKIMK